MIQLSTLFECYARIVPQSRVTTVFGAVGAHLYNAVLALPLMPTESELKRIKGVTMTLQLVPSKCTVEANGCQQQELPGVTGDQSVRVDKDIKFAVSVSDLSQTRAVVMIRE